MTAFLHYIALSGLYLGVFYAFYLLVMRRTTFFTLNRFVVLLGSVACALLPLLRVRTTSLLAAAGPMTIIGAGEAAADGSAAGTFSWSGWLTVLYVTGIVAVAGYTLISALLLHRRVSGGTRTRIEGFKTVILSDNLPSFTFGKTIFIGRKDLEQHPAIFSHEAMHVVKRHYLDLSLFCAIQTLWWWNPLVWIMRTELGLLHEYEADEGVISKGIDATQYQLLLVRKAVGEQRFSLASGFQHAQLKNRIAMMLKHSSNGWMRLSYLVLIPLLAVFVYAYNPSKKSEAPAENTETVAPATKAEATDPAAATENIPFADVEQKPTFNGGDANEFAKWVSSQVKYPEAAKEAGQQGRVLVQFTVNTDGSISDAKILRGASPELDAEALRVVNSCTQKWTPGMQDGKPVPVSFSFPFVFQFK